MTLEIAKTKGVHIRLNIRASRNTQWNGKPKWEPSYRSAYQATKVINWEYENLLQRLRSNGMDEKIYRAIFS